jgi:hypothetical protein
VTSGTGSSVGGGKGGGVKGDVGLWRRGRHWRRRQRGGGGVGGGVGGNVVDGVGGGVGVWIGNVIGGAVGPAWEPPLGCWMVALSEVKLDQQLESQWARHSDG